MHHCNRPTPRFSLRKTLTLISLFLTYSIFAQNNPAEVKRGHQGWLQTYTLSPSNKHLVTAGTDHQLVIWDYNTGRQIREIKDQAEITGLAISTDDRFLYSVDTARVVKKWDLATGKKLLEFVAHQTRGNEEDQEGYLEALDIDEAQEKKLDQYRLAKTARKVYIPHETHLVLSDNGQFLATGGRDRQINVWNTYTGKLLHRFTGAQGPITALFWSKDQHYLISQDQSFSVTIRAYPSGKIIKTFRSKSDLTAQNLSRNGLYLSYLSDYDTFQKVSLANGSVVSSVLLNKKIHTLLDLADETRILGIGNLDSNFYFDVKTGNLLAKNVGINAAKNFTLDLQGRIVFMQESNKKVQVFNPQAQTMSDTRFGVFVPDIQSITFSEGGEHILVNDAEQNLELIDLNNIVKPGIKSYSLQKYWYKHHAVLSPDAKKLAISNGNGDLQVWDIASQSVQNGYVSYTSSPVFRQGWSRVSPAISALSFSPNGAFIILADYTYGLYFFDANKPSDQFVYSEVLYDEINMMQSRRDSAKLWVNQLSHSYGDFFQFDIQGISKENVASRKLIKKLQINNLNDPLTDFSFSNNQQYLIYTTNQRLSGVYAMEGGQILVSYQNCILAQWLGKVHKYVLFQSHKNVTIWDVENRKTSVQYTLPYVPLHAALHPSGNFLLLVLPDQTIELRDVKDGKVLFTAYWQAGNNIFQFITGGEDGWKSFQSKIKQQEFQGISQPTPSTKDSTAVIIANDLEELILNIGHQNPIKHLSIHENGKLLWTVDDKGTGKIWDLKLGRELRTVTHPTLGSPHNYQYTPEASKINFYTDGERFWQLDLHTGRVVQLAESTANTSNNYNETFKYTTLNFANPAGKPLVKKLPGKFSIIRYAPNFDKKIMSVYGAFEYDNNLLISYYGEKNQDSIVLKMDLEYPDRKITDLWARPGTDSLIAKTGEGSMFIFHPLRRELKRVKFIDNEKVASFLFSPNRQYFVRALANNGVVEIRKTIDKSLHLRKNFPCERLSLLSFSNTGQNLLLSDGSTIWNWDLVKDTLYQFSDYRINNPETRAYESGRYAHLLASGKLIFQYSNLDNSARFKIFDLRTGQHQTVEKGNMGSTLFATKDRFYVEEYGTYSSLLDEQQLVFPHATINGISKMCFSSKENLVGLIHSGANTFSYWDLEQQKELFRKTSRESFYNVAISPTDSLIALSGRKIVFLLGARDGKEKTVIPVETQSSSRIILQFSADSRYLFINCPYEGIVMIWDINRKTLLKSFSFYRDTGYLVGVSPDQQTFYGAIDGAVFAYNQQGKELYRLQLKERDIVEYFPDDQKIIVASTKGVIHQIDAETGTWLKTLYLGNKQNWIALEPDHQFTTSPHARDYVHFRNKKGTIGFFPASNKPENIVQNEALPALLSTKNVVNKPGESVTKTNDNNFWIVNEVWKTQLTGTPDPNPEENIRANSLWFANSLQKVQFCRNDELLIAQEKNGSLSFIEHATVRLLKKVKGRFTLPFVVSENSKQVVCLEQGNTIHVYDLQTGTLQQKKAFENIKITALNISPNGKVLVLGTFDGSLHLLKIADLSLIQSIQTSEYKITCLAFNAKNEQVICADINANLYALNLLPNLSLSKPIFLGQRSAYGIINQIGFFSENTLIIDASKQVYSIQYKGFTKNFQPISLPNHDHPIYFDPLNPTRFYYFNKGSYDFRWAVYDLVKKAKVDSIKGNEFIYCISKSGQHAVVSYRYPDQYLELYDLKAGRKRTTLESKLEGVSNFEIIGSSMYYSNYNFPKRTYKVDLKSAQMETLPIQFDQGSFLQEKGQISMVGSLIKPRGIGKVALSDTTMNWAIVKTRETGYSSSNGHYIVYYLYPQDTMRVYNVVEQKLICKLLIPAKERGSLFISDNGKYLAVASSSGIGVKVYDLSTQKLILTDDQSIGNPLFTNDQKIILNGMQENRIYDLTSSELIRNFFRSDDQMHPRFILSSSSYGILSTYGRYCQLWNLAKNTCVGDFYFFNLGETTSAWVFISSDGRYDGSSAGLAQLYYLDDKKLGSKPVNHQEDPKYQPGLLDMLMK